MKNVSILLSLLFIILIFPASGQVERWDYFEITLKGPQKGNPFTDVELSATFSNKEETATIKGFYDGDGIYRIRFMPRHIGQWNYVTESNIKKLDNKKGTFECIKPSEKNHGMVHVDKQYHFRYDDGTPYYPFGTTCYSWTNQLDSLQEMT